MYVTCASWEAFYSHQEVKIVKLIRTLSFDSSQEWNQTRSEALCTFDPAQSWAHGGHWINVSWLRDAFPLVIWIVWCRTIFFLLFINSSQVVTNSVCILVQFNQFLKDKWHLLFPGHSPFSYVTKTATKKQWPFLLEYHIEISFLIHIYHHLHSYRSLPNPFQPIFHFQWIFVVWNNFF